MKNEKYQKIVENHAPKEDSIKNGLIAFLAGGTIGVIGQFLQELYISWWNIPSKEAGVIVILTFVILGSLLTAFGVFDILMNTFKAALLIPITGFAHSMTSAALEYKHEGLILGIGSNIFKLAGSVILYGVVSVYIFGLIRLLVFGG